MTDPNADLLRRYFNGRRFQVSATLERRIVDQLEDGRQARSRTSPRRIAVRAVVAVAALAIAAAGTTLPAAASTTPLAPGARHILSTVGMSGVVERLMTTQSQATADGHTVSLAGVFATRDQTVVILKLTPAAPAGSDWFMDVSLFDASGAAVPAHQGVVTPSYAWFRLAAIPGVASAPQKVTLVVSASFGASWTLQFDTTTQGRFLPRPAAGQAGKIGVTFDSVVVTPLALAIDATTTGATLSSFCPGMTGSDPLGPTGLEASCEIGTPLSGDGGGDGTGSVGLSVQDASGKPLTTISPLTISVDRQLLARSELRHEGVWQLHGPGQYRVVFTAPDGTTVVRTVQVQG